MSALKASLRLLAHQLDAAAAGRAERLSASPTLLMVPSSIDALARLVDETPGAQRDAQAGGDRRQQRDVALVERVLAIEVLEGDDAHHLVADGEWREDRRLRRLRRRSPPLARPRRRAPARSSVTSIGSPVSTTCLRKPMTGRGSSARSHAALDGVREAHEIRRHGRRWRCRPPACRRRPAPAPRPARTWRRCRAPPPGRAARCS